MDPSDAWVAKMLRVGALVMIGVLLVVSLLYAVYEVREARAEVRAIRGLGDSEDMFDGSRFGADLLVLFSWFAAVGIGLIGVLVGTLQLMLTRQRPWLIAAYAVLAAGLVGGAWISEYYRHADVPFLDDTSWYTLGALAAPVTALVVLGASAWLLRQAERQSADRSGTLVMTSIRVPSGSV